MGARTVLEEVYRINSELRVEGERKVRPKGTTNKPVGFWVEYEPVYEDTNVRLLKSLVIILGTRGCRWAWQGRGGGCIYCGYVYKNPRGGGNLIKQITYVVSRKSKQANEIELVKIFTSGSFLDDFEVGREERIQILGLLKEAFPNLKIFQLESRPEHVLNRGILEDLSKIDTEIFFNVGLETTDNFLLELINKGFKLDIYKKALKMAHENGFKVKTYVMLKQPFQTEREAIEDAIKSSKEAIDLGTDVISINPMVVYSYTFVEFLWRRGLYRPPWLNSVLHVVREALRYARDKGVVVISDPVAPGSSRGPHSCNKACDKKLSKALKDMVENQNPDVEIPSCCEELWKRFLDEEDFKKDLSYSSLLP